MTTAISVFAVLSFSIACFLGKEFLRKFRFMQEFVAASKQTVTFQHDGKRTPGMHNIVLRGKAPFSVLVGFQLEIPIIGYSGYDYFWFARSDRNGVAVVSAYLGKKPAEFVFLSADSLASNGISATSTAEDEALHPDAVFPPHWWQRLGFFG